jgi:Poxvirus A32 protein
MHDEVIKLYADNGGLSLIIGNLGSGKTHYALKILVPAIYTIYERIYFFSTSRDFQKGDAYKDLKQFNIKTLPFFNLNVIESLVEYKKKHHKKQWLLVIDDATSLDDILKSNNELVKFLFTNLRHLGIRLIFIVHGSKSIITPLIRSLTTHLVICKTTNLKLLEGIYEEYVAMFLDKKLFIQSYKEKVFNKKYCNLQFLNTTKKIFYYCPEDQKEHEPLVVRYAKAASHN